MVKASALYMVIVIALVIGIICSSLVAVAYFFRQQQQQAERYGALQNNVYSGVNMLITDNRTDFSAGTKLSLFDGDADSVMLKRVAWGIYDVGVSRAFIQGDTLTKIFSMGYAVDSARWAALYLPDEDRSLSVSGKTVIKGDVYIPKSGVRQAYIDGNPYQGDQRIIIGRTMNSQKQLPQLNASRINDIARKFDRNGISQAGNLPWDSLSVSFLTDTKTISAGKNVLTLDHIHLRGNIIIQSDTTVIIGSNARLENILVFAPYIKVAKGFNGTCQLFASDSLRVEPGCTLNYPSALGVVKLKTSKIVPPALLNIADNVDFSGCIFTYDENAEGSKQPLVSLGKKTRIQGQVYAPGLLEISDGTRVNGSVFTGRFLYKSGITRYENYIVNTTIDAQALPQYYLSSDLIPVVSAKRKILQWLDPK